MYKKDRKKVSIFFVLALLSVLVSIIAFYIYNNIEVGRISKLNSDLREEIKTEQQENHRKTIEIEKLTSYERIKNYAVSNLSLNVSDSSSIDNKVIKIQKNSMR